MTESSFVSLYVYDINFYKIFLMLSRAGSVNENIFYTYFLHLLFFFEIFHSMVRNVRASHFKDCVFLKTRPNN